MFDSFIGLWAARAVVVNALASPWQGRGSPCILESVLVVSAQSYWSGSTSASYRLEANCDNDLPFRRGWKI